MRYKGFVALAITLLVCATVHASECEVSLPDRTDVPGWQVKGFVWVGDHKLAAMVPDSGAWTGMGPEHHYFDKWWWWREGYRAQDENEPELTITAKRLDGKAPEVVISDATNAFGKDWHRMLVGMEFPTAGCWEVIGQYHGHELRFVFKVGS